LVLLIFHKKLSMKKVLFLFLLLFAVLLGSFIYTPNRDLFTIKIIRISNNQKTDIEKENVGQNKIKIPSKTDIYKR
jgi:cell division septal protein FtsQ